MEINELVKDSSYFGIVLSLASYAIGFSIQKKWNKVYLNPLLIAVLLIILVLLVTGVDLETYSYSAGHLSYFLTPVTVALAVPLYKQVQVLKENILAIVISIGIGCLAHALVVIVVLSAFGAPRELLLSLLPKSVTSAIGLSLASEIGGIPGITIIGIMIAGVSGAVVGPSILKWVGVDEPIAQGLALGSASHATGTSKAIELGEVQAAMSSLAIVVTGIMTVFILPTVVRLLEII